MTPTNFRFVGVASMFGFGLLCRCPLAADWRDDCALLLKFLHSLVYLLTVKTANLCNLTCVHRLTSLYHCCQYLLFCVHNLISF